jgi:hypothetical protein
MLYVTLCYVMWCYVILHYIVKLWDIRRIYGPLLTETSLCGAYLFLRPVLHNGKAHSGLFAPSPQITISFYSFNPSNVVTSIFLPPCDVRSGPVRLVAPFYTRGKMDQRPTEVCHDTKAGHNRKMWMICRHTSRSYLEVLINGVADVFLATSVP